MENEKIKLIECISQTHQGEGPDSGYRMLLCRFKYCNMNCNFCDTKIKMRALAETEIKLKNLQYIINQEKVGIMATGGEPTIDKHFNDTLKLLNQLSYPIANVETNGYNLLELIKQVDSTKNVHYIFSPKIFNDSQWETSISLSTKLIKYNNVFLKVVVQNDEYTEDFLKHITKIFPTNRIYLMPLGETKEELFKHSPLMMDLADKYKTNITSRMHLIYDFV